MASEGCFLGIKDRSAGSTSEYMAVPWAYLLLSEALNEELVVLVLLESYPEVTEGYLKICIFHIKPSMTTGSKLHPLSTYMTIMFHYLTSHSK